MVERHVTVDGRQTSMSLCVSEVTVLASQAGPAATAACTCADLELGAHVAEMRGLAAPMYATGGGTSPVFPPTPSSLSPSPAAVGRSPRPSDKLKRGGVPGPAAALTGTTVDADCLHPARKSCPTERLRAEVNAGMTARALATTSTPRASAAIVSPGTATTGTAPRLAAKSFQMTRPATMPRRNADHDADQCNRRGLPEHGGADLQVHKAKSFEQPHLLAAPDHADHEEMEEGCRTEHGQHTPEDEREVHRLPEVEQRGRNGRPVRAALGDIAGDVGLALGTGPCLRQDNEILTASERLYGTH